MALNGHGGPDVGLILMLFLTVAAVAAAVRIIRLPYPVALVLAGLALALTPGTPRVDLATILAGHFSPTQAVANFVAVAAGGLVVGAAIGTLASHVLARIDDALLEATITLTVAYGSYLLAEQLGVSGVLAVVVAGLI